MYHPYKLSYLNNNPDGCTYFKYQQIKTPAEKGLTLIWPSDFTHTHKGEISNKEEKYIITGWLGFALSYIIWECSKSSLINFCGF